MRFYHVSTTESLNPLLINTHHCHVVQHATVYSALIKLGFILREANIIQPS